MILDSERGSGSTIRHWTACANSSPRPANSSTRGADRLSRYHVSLWDELADLGISVGGQRGVDQQCRSPAGLAGADPPPDPPRAHGRAAAYQRARASTGCTRSGRRGLGGILADDMGLGKTVQTLALLEHARGRRTHQPVSSSPRRGMLGVGPAKPHASPELRVVVLGETTKRRASRSPRRSPMPTWRHLLCGGAHRRRRVRRPAVAWLILDEAQFVKKSPWQDPCVPRGLPLGGRGSVTRPARRWRTPSWTCGRCSHSWPRALSSCGQVRRVLSPPHRGREMRPGFSIGYAVGQAAHAPDQRWLRPTCPGEAGAAGSPSTSPVHRRIWRPAPPTRTSARPAARRSRRQPGRDPRRAHPTAPTQPRSGAGRSRQGESRHTGQDRTLTEQPRRVACGRTPGARLQSSSRPSSSSSRTI